MKIEITTRKIPARRALRAYVARQLSHALDRFAAHVTLARVELSDRNGRRGGGDKRCRIYVSLADGVALKVEDVRANVREAISHAADMARSAVHGQRKLALVRA